MTRDDGINADEDGTDSDGGGIVGGGDDDDIGT